MPFVQARRLTIHYEVAGTGDDVLLLVHGNFASWRWWRPVLDRLPPGYCAYAPDMRGCGDTDRPAHGYTIPQLSADLLGFARALRLPALHLVGHSLGGAVALQFALDHADLVRTLTLVAPAPAEGLPVFRNASAASPWVLRLFDLERDASLNRLDAIYRFLYTLDANRPLLRRALTRMAPMLTDEDALKALLDDAGRMAPAAVVGHVRALNTWNVQTQLAKVALPVLVVWGEQDVLIPRPALERMVSGLRDGRLVIWPDVGHAPQLEQPDRFVQLLAEFISVNGRGKHSALFRTGGRSRLRGLWERLWLRLLSARS